MASVVVAGGDSTMYVDSPVDPAPGAVDAGPAPAPARSLWDYLPRGNTLDDRSWHHRHRLLLRTLALHLPALAVLGLALGNPVLVIGATLLGPVAGLAAGVLVAHRRLASFFVTGGLVFCSAGLVVLTSGSIEAHFHFFIIIGFIALYQDWVPFLWNVAFTVLSHGIGTIWLGGLIFAHPAGQANPWLWSAIHGLGVLAACVGMVIFWRITEDEQSQKEELSRQLVTADAEIGRRRFASDMLVNLARRNQSMLYRQLDIINQLEEKEQDPDALADLFTLDHLATRVRRNAESLLVLAGEQPPRTWTAPVPLRDVVRAAIAETEDLDRVTTVIDDRVGAVSGRSVADLTHLLAELTENAVRFSPPDTTVTVRARPDPRAENACLVTVEDWGVGMPEADLAAANEQLADPQDVDLAVAQRLGFHVVARLAARHGIGVSLGATPGSGVTAVVVLPSALFLSPPGGVPLPRRAPGDQTPARHAARFDGATPAAVEPPVRTAAPVPEPASAWATPFAVPTEGAPSGDWEGWWRPETGAPQERFDAPPRPVGGPVPAVPSPRPRPAAEPPGPVEPGRGGLRRRVPQAHLAPELRGPAAPDPAGPAHDGAAVSALSRYQASRSAAQLAVDNGGAS
ncbi:sensor histidine kinase [Pseudonocardia abyssalis]|uniref:histidine kinase n=1 Tax=Pseudonocardia abyssalis TaxID=2792008 RepID=A0ABS6V1H5_9PSEU|nr:ATP-binding protein [Pseudonocardia abyssalis]MBW0117907.1 sensor histidine kinase [Pseudonocardia abyssalis]MBW0138242.1 sensor histidine kinase [Pseudonocardia abyssalis]